MFDVIPTAQKFGYDFDSDFLSMLSEDGLTMPKKVWLPINQLGVTGGLKFENGQITMPQSSRSAYNQSVGGGWAFHFHQARTRRHGNSNILPIGNMGDSHIHEHGNECTTSIDFGCL